MGLALASSELAEAPGIRQSIKNVGQFITRLQDLVYVSEYIVKTVPVRLQEVDCLDFSDLVFTFPQEFGLDLLGYRRNLQARLH